MLFQHRFLHYGALVVTAIAAFALGGASGCGESPDSGCGSGGGTEGEGAPAIEFTEVPPRGSHKDLEGEVSNVAYDDHAVAVFIRVGSGWWTKPYWATPGTEIECDGDFETDITTGGIDSSANRITAFVVPSDYDIPLASGHRSLPPGIAEAALVSASIDR